MPQVDHITFIKIGGCICFLLIVGYLLFNFVTFFTLSFFQKYFNFESLSINTYKGIYLFI